MVASLLTGLVASSTPVAAEATILRTITADVPPCSVGVGIAFDGSRLIVSCAYTGTFYAVSPADGSLVASYPIAGAPSFGAMAWDRGRGKLWACRGFGDDRVLLVDLATRTETVQLTTQGCADGLAYDAADDTLWASDDVASTVQHYRLDGTLISSNSVSGKLGSCGSSGIAVGGRSLFLANNGCSEIYEVSKDFSTSTLFGTYPARLEDLECDDVTFRGQGKAAIWSKDAYDNVLNAFEIDRGDCGFGGRSALPLVPNGQLYGGRLIDGLAPGWGWGGGRGTSAVKADPVDTAIGAFVHAEVDASLGGLGVPFVLARSYTSADDTVGPLGRGWTFTPGANLAGQADGSQLLRAPDGAQVRYQRLGDGSYLRPPGARATLVATPTGHELIRPDQARFAFDQQGRLVSLVDAQGRGVSLAYQEGRLASATDAAGRTVTFGYDADGRLAFARLPDGRQASYGYTGGLLSSATDPAGATTSYTYDAGGRLEAVVDPAGVAQVRNTYGADGRVTTQLDALGNATTFSWDPATQTATTTDARGATWSDVYLDNVLLESGGPAGVLKLDWDGDANVVAETDARGNVASFAYDAAGNVVARRLPGTPPGDESFDYDGANRLTGYTDALGATTSYAYDAAGRLVTRTRPEGVVDRSAYDDAGRLVSSTDPLGKITTYRWDAAGNLTAVVSPLGNTTGFAYDGSGRLVAEVDPRGMVPEANSADYATTYSYDDADRLVRETRPSARTTSYAYDAAGRLVSTTAPAGSDPAGAVTTYAYDLAGQLVAETDPRGKTTTFGYDSRGQRTSVTSPTGSRTTFAYDGAGRLVARTSPRGNHPGADPAAYTWVFGYDADGNRTSEGDPLSNQRSWTYDAQGRPVTETDAAGRTTTSSYDAAGRLVATTDPLGGTATVAYDSLGRPVAETDASGRTTSSTYDAAGHLVAVGSPGGSVTTHAYDDDGRLVATVEPRGNQAGADAAAYRSTQEYDPAGHRVAATDPLGNRTVFGWKPGGELGLVTDALGRTTRYHHDRAGRLAGVEGPDASVSTLAYDPAGNLVARTDAAGHTVSFDYDDDARLVAETDALGRTTTHAYDDDANPTTTLDARAQAADDPVAGTTSRTFDPLGRLTAISYSDGTPAVSFAYDAVGNRVQMADGGGTQTYAYDAGDRLVGVTRGPDAFSYAYDPAGRVTRRTLPDGTVVAYGYDADGRINTVTTAGQVATYAYDASGHPVSTSLPNGVATTRTWDRARRLSGLTTARGNDTLASFTYARDAVGNPTTVATAAGPETYAYDALDRLTQVCYGPCAWSSHFRRWTYDLVGNRLSEETEAATTHYAYDAGDQLVSSTTGGITTTISEDGGLQTPVGGVSTGIQVHAGPIGGSTTTYQHDPRGFMTRAGAGEFGWDGAGRMVTAGADTMSYDGDGNRLSRSGSAGTSQYRWDPNAELPLLAIERTATTSSTYTQGADGPLGLQSAAGTSYYGMDGLGSVTTLTGQDGTLQRSYAYEAFGATRAETAADGAPGNPLQFTGQYRDADGRYNLRARVYDPSLGRLLSVDPIAPALDEPSVSRYTYVANRPTVLVDPSGELGQPGAGRPGLLGQCRFNPVTGTFSCTNPFQGPIAPPRRPPAPGRPGVGPGVKSGIALLGLAAGCVLSGICGPNPAPPCSAPQTTPTGDCDQNRGRIQVQGSDVPPDLSWSWARATPPTAQEARTELARLETGLTNRQREVRTQAFQRARRQVEQCQASGGCNAPMSRSYQNRNLPRAVRDARVDIEIWTGRAFT